MKSKLFTLLLVLALGAMLAGQNAPMPPGHPMLADPEKFADGHVAALDRQVHLSPDQKPKVRAVFLEEGKQLFAVLSHTGLSPQQKHAAIQKLHMETAAKVNALLTPEQRRPAPAERQAPLGTTQT
jgi:hypothetical protein